MINNKNTGVIAYGVKTGIITPKDKIVEIIKTTFKKNPELLKNEDILCVKEAVVAITQNNFVNLSDISKDINNKLKLKKNSKIGVLFPITSRNRFSLILQAIASSVPNGKVIVQLSFPADEQGNQIISEDFLRKKKLKSEDKITLQMIGKNRFLHPETGMDYIKFYEDIIKEKGAKAEIFLSNNPEDIIKSKIDGLIISNVHDRNNLLKKIKPKFKNTITLQDICSNKNEKAHSEYGLLGSNILDPDKGLLKLPPRDADKVSLEIQKMVKKEFKKNIEVMVYGDGAYKDPDTGIYELADPVCAFGVTSGIKNTRRVGVKTKYLMQKLYSEGKSKEEIIKAIEREKKRIMSGTDKREIACEGTTPRKVKNLVASLADLVSGSADANTPVVIVRGFI
ncbi:MAG TPA: coenzyme F420-0:L-glutamate ligase [Candidatus Diapherotrites archaeon]|nr:coenzyme F420-0:L-glutamate ligase [Candidatus Diapherotrites archaeon]